MTEQFVLMAIGLIAAAFVLRPLVRGAGKRAGTRATPATPASLAPSDELAELELDRAMGRVSDEDYARWRSELGDAAPRSAESQTAAAGDARVRAEALVRRWKDAPRPTCPDCGVRPEPEARFCSNCGALLGS